VPVAFAGIWAARQEYASASLAHSGLRSGAGVHLGTGSSEISVAHGGSTAMLSYVTL